MSAFLGRVGSPRLSLNLLCTDVVHSLVFHVDTSDVVLALACAQATVFFQHAVPVRQGHTSM